MCPSGYFLSCPVNETEHKQPRLLSQICYFGQVCHVSHFRLSVSLTWPLTAPHTLLQPDHFDQMTNIDDPVTRASCVRGAGSYWPIRVRYSGLECVPWRCDLSIYTTDKPMYLAKRLNDSDFLEDLQFFKAETLPCTTSRSQTLSKNITQPTSREDK